MNYLFRKLLIVCLLLIPSAIFAQVAGPTDTLGIFDLDTQHDPSYIFLGQVFGSVGPVLHTTTGILLGTLFKYFNLGVLVVAGIFLLWTTVKIIIHSSHEGSFMGKDSKVGMNVLRTVFGISLLTPSVGGYSVIQMFVMWAVLQGCGFANTVWGQALNYFEAGGEVLLSPGTPLTPLVAMAGTVLQAQVCMKYSEKLENDLQQDAVNQIAAGNTAPVYTTRKAVFPAFQPYYDTANRVVNFPSSRGNQHNDAGCGQISWHQADNPSWDATVLGALQQVVADLGPAAQRIARPYPSDTTPIPSSVPGITTTSALQDLTMQAVVYAAQDWVNLLSVIRASGTSGGAPQAFFDQARQDGWLYAGSYYYRLGQINRAVAATVNVRFILNVPPACLPPATNGYLSFGSSGPTFLGTCIDEKTAYYANPLSFPAFDAKYTLAANYVAAATYLAQEAERGSIAATAGTAAEGAGPHLHAPHMGPMGLIAEPAINVMRDGVESLSHPGDPILKLQVMGTHFIEAVVSIWFGVSMAMFGLGMVTNMCQSVMPIGAAIRDGLSIFLPILMAYLMLIFVEGTIFAVYVPLIPFIIFTFTVLGWFILVIEAMVAAPLVALGITHPEGHDFLGASQQAVMLIMSVFLRPVLMVIGLIAGMLLSVIGLTIFNSAYKTMIGYAMGVGGITATMFIYAVLVMQVVTQCYSLIYMIPDRVMRWLGQAPEQSMVGQALQAAESKTKEEGQAGAKGMESGFQASMGAGKGQGESEGGGGGSGGKGS